MHLRKNAEAARPWSSYTVFERLKTISYHHKFKKKSSLVIRQDYLLHQYDVNVEILIKHAVIETFRSPKRLWSNYWARQKPVFPDVYISQRRKNIIGPNS
jgi:hypothetical protein